MPRGDFYPAEQDEFLAFARSFVPLSDEEVSMQVLKNGPYIFDDKFMFIRAMPWLMSKGVLHLRPADFLLNPSVRKYIGFEANHCSVIGSIEEHYQIDYKYQEFNLIIPWIGEVRNILRRAAAGLTY